MHAPRDAAETGAAVAVAISRLSTITHKKTISALKPIRSRFIDPRQLGTAAKRLSRFLLQCIPTGTYLINYFFRFVNA